MTQENIFVTSMEACKMYANDHILAILGKHANHSEIDHQTLNHFFRHDELKKAEKDLSQYNFNMNLHDLGRESEEDHKKGWYMFNRESQEEMMLLFLLNVITIAHKSGQMNVDISELRI
jgi:hypothetical protein